MRLAILEDDPDQLALIRHWLEPDRHDIHPFDRGRDLQRIAGRESFDLFILDWQVPDITGIDVLAWLRRNVSRTVPVLFTTVRDSEADIVEALNQGADDYMIKPIRRHELLARVNALLRRAYPETESTQLAFPPYEFNLTAGELRHDGKRVELTRKEFELAAMLFRNIGRLLSRGHVYEAVWGRSGDLRSRTVDTHISQVRKKLNLGPETGYKLTPIYNYGYRLDKVS